MFGKAINAMIFGELTNYSFYQNMLTIVILLSSYISLFLFRITKKSDILNISLLFIWHTLFSIIYYLFTLNNIADARKYYLDSLSLDYNVFYYGTQFITYVTSIFTQGIDASYLNVTLIFNFFGSMGLILLYLSLKDFFIAMGRHWMLLLILPSMSFWSAGLGKDSLAFFCTCLFLYSIVSNKKDPILLSVSFVLMFLIRPHIAFMMLMSYVIYFVVRAKVRIIFKVIILPIIFLGMISAFGVVQQFVGIGDISFDSVGEYVDKRQGTNLEGGSSLDISSLSYPMQMFTYIFRPLPFEAHNMLALVTSLENLLLLCLFVYILFKSRFNLKTWIHGKNLWLFSYVLLTCTVLALTTANLGIATRQKWMFMPVLIYLLMYAFYSKKQKVI